MVLVNSLIGNVGLLCGSLCFEGLLHLCTSTAVFPKPLLQRGIGTWSQRLGPSFSTCQTWGSGYFSLTCLSGVAPLANKDGGCVSLLSAFSQVIGHPNQAFTLEAQNPILW